MTETRDPNLINVTRLTDRLAAKRSALSATVAARAAIRSESAIDAELHKALEYWHNEVVGIKRDRADDEEE